MPLYRRLPKRGFYQPFAKRYSIVNLGRLQQAIEAGRLDAEKPVDAAALQAAGIIKSARDGVRLLAKGDFKAKITVKVAGASKSAIAAVEKAGGKVIVAQPKSEAEAGEGRSVRGGLTPGSTPGAKHGFCR